MSGEQKEPQQQCALSTHTCRSHGPTPRFPSIESVRTEKMKGEKSVSKRNWSATFSNAINIPKLSLENIIFIYYEQLHMNRKTVSQDTTLNSLAQWKRQREQKMVPFVNCTLPALRLTDF